MARKPVERFALGWIGSQVADQGAFGRIFAEFLDLRQIILHRQCSVLRKRNVQPMFESEQT
ncbi:hypothetical protein XI05_24115 [Bradyrhizobium sp. CCBAU 11357]|nr:hypothetical protein [Bradyrhizobium sp. CCBAU 11357]